METKKEFKPISNVISGHKFKNITLNTLNDISNTIKRTMGPFGNHAILADKFLQHVISKDGYELLRRLTYVEREATVILDIVKETSRRLVRKVGDGSSTAIVSSSELFRQFYNNEQKKFRPGALSIALKIAANTIGNKICDEATHINDLSIDENKKLLENIATIAANNDKGAGKLISSAFIDYGEDANVIVERSTIDTTNITPRAGYKILNGIIDRSFLDKNAKERRMEKPFVLLFKEVVDMRIFHKYFASLFNKVFASGNSIVLIAEDFESKFLNLMIAERVKSDGHFPILLINHSLGSEKTRSKFDDISYVSGAKVLDETILSSFQEKDDDGKIKENELVLLPESILGKIDSIHADQTQITILPKKDQEDSIRARLSSINDEIELAERMNTDGLQDELLTSLRARTRSLNGKEVVISVGGATESEKTAKMHLYEDATLACKAALETGISFGLGISIMYYIETLKEVLVELISNRLKDEVPLNEAERIELSEYVLECIHKAWKTVACNVLENGGHRDPLGEIERCIKEKHAKIKWTYEEDEVVENIILPAKTDHETLFAVASIVSLLAASDQIVLTSPVVEIEE
jgi:chaperonin GroEL (HSP60 family)